MKMSSGPMTPCSLVNM